MRAPAVVIVAVATIGCQDNRFIPTEPTPLSQLPVTYSIPVSCFETRPDPPVTTVGQPIVLDARCSVEGNEPILDYDWELGDGRRVRGNRVDVRYDEPGEYDVQLTVREESGQDDISSRRVIVR